MGAVGGALRTLVNDLLDMSLRTIALPRLDHSRVLVVDDDLEGSAIMARSVEGRGADVRCIA